MFRAVVDVEVRAASGGRSPARFRSLCLSGLCLGGSDELHQTSSA